jgi:hypothetical protein
MTPAVISLESHRRNRPPACTCARHQLEALAERARARREDLGGTLLVPVEALAELVDDVRRTVTAALADNARSRP